MEISNPDLDELRFAKALLENPSLAIKIAGAVGKPIEAGIEYLPARWKGAVARATQNALQTAMDLAIVSLSDDRPGRSSDRLHKMIVAATGAGGGAFGLGGVSVELPISTTVMLRSVADIARSHGERIKSPETKVECMKVFALGGAVRGDDAAESGYFAVRAALAKAANDAARHIAARGMSAKSAPPNLRFVTSVAERFGVAVSEKIAAQALPLIGAAGGALVNVVFIDHFQDMARGHFTVRRLERKYDPQLVRNVFLRMK
jgi:hypothetical protein